jgi:predicted small lipoprotein YifL
MKKTVLGILAVAAMSLSLASCGDKLLTPDQVTAEVQKGFDAGKAAVESEMSSKCDATFEARVTDKVNTMTKEADAAKAEEEKKAAEAKKPAIKPVLKKK